ncbi:Hint domain-containing protein [Tropicibacter alexandrii]|uniref:Hint domain-containing protein n=1 Tax=Tropicibacter alexandrii TaxID=2267683 RepID=UPI000EF49E52|nr:Hint domain-containing protein [Tropicibacter alexandrii]
MVFSIYGQDNEFATATGSNVGVSPGQSSFDYPPNGTQNLIITTKAGDPDPRLFEIGDTYEITWAGTGGGGTITDAVVTRSDAVGTDGVIVFEGLDENGDLAEVIWTPGFDLENWYWSNFSGGNPPQFFTTDQNAAYTHEFVCFEKSARIHTPRGLIPAGRIKPGDWVCTWSGRKQQVRWVGQRSVAADGPAAPVRFDVGTIGNFKPLKLSPQHRVLIASTEAELLFGAREVLVPAIALVDGAGVKQMRRREVTYVHILLDRHDILICEGAPCESLLPGWRTRDLLTPEDREAVRAALNDESRKPCRLILTRSEARVLLPNRVTPHREPALL